MRKLLEKNWGVDSNIIIYALDRDSVFFKKAETFFKNVKNLRLYIAHQNIIEIEKVLISFYKIDKKKVIENLERFLTAFNFNIISPLPTTLALYHQLMIDLKEKESAFDFYLAATYLDNKIDHLFTVNVKDFFAIKKLTAVNPFDYFS